jgi:hypothetical protein
MSRDGNMANHPPQSALLLQRGAPPMKTITIEWGGPYSWPRYEKLNGLPSLPAHGGVYLETVEYADGYLIRGNGQSACYLRRFVQHTRSKLGGEHTVLDPAALRQGRREEIWHGWGYARAHRAEFAQRQTEIQTAAKAEMAAYRLFVSSPIASKRERERLEAEVMDALYAAPPPFCDIPDRGTYLARRQPHEPPITISNVCAHKLHALPAQMTI